MTLTYFLKVRDSNRYKLGRLKVIISQKVKGSATITIAHTESRLLVFDWYIYILPWPILKVKVKVMQILTVTIS